MNINLLSFLDQRKGKSYFGSVESQQLLALLYELRTHLADVVRKHNELKEQNEKLKAENDRLRTIVPEVLENINDELCDENEKLRQLAACAYQFAGAHDAPVEWLDALSNAADGRPFDTSKLLPYDGGNIK
jgi:predicted nuclease with TOPRIM domain